MKDKSAHPTARRVLSLIKEILNYAVDMELIENNVASSIEAKKVIGEKKDNHYPTIKDPDELRELLLAIEDYGGEIATKQALRLMPYVVLRQGNIINGKWSQIDFKNKRWTIPAEEMKGGREHTIPLTDSMIRILKEMHRYSGHGKYIFSNNPTQNKRLSENTLNKALRSLGYKVEKRFTTHSFRSVFSTFAYENLKVHNCSAKAIEMQLAHKERDRTSAAYNHASFFDERKTLMQWWSDYLDNLKSREG
jgi:integrase